LLIASKGGGIGAIIVSLLIGLITVVLQIVALIRTGEWTNYTLLDLIRYFGWQTPISISDYEDVDYLWGAFLREGSLALTFLLYIPTIIFLIGLAIWQLINFAQPPSN